MEIFIRLLPIFIFSLGFVSGWFMRKMTNEKTLKFEVGDSVVARNDEFKGVVTKADSDGIYVLWEDGSCGFHLFDDCFNIVKSHAR